MKLYIKEFCTNNSLKITWCKQWIIYHTGAIYVSKGDTRVGYNVMRDCNLTVLTYVDWIAARFSNQNTLSRDERELLNTVINAYLKTGTKIEV